MRIALHAVFGSRDAVGDVGVARAVPFLSFRYSTGIQGTSLLLLSLVYGDHV